MQKIKRDPLHTHTNRGKGQHLLFRSLKSSFSAKNEMYVLWKMKGGNGCLRCPVYLYKQCIIYQEVRSLQLDQLLVGNVSLFTQEASSLRKVGYGYPNLSSMMKPFLPDLNMVVR